jgi:glucose-6-phosphate 1-dehydrogenase
MKKTFPALFALMRQRHLPADVAIIGYARDALTKAQFHKLVYRAIYNIGHPESDRQRFLARIDYRHGQFDDPGAYAGLRAALEANEKAQEDDWLSANSSPCGEADSQQGSPPLKTLNPLADGSGGSGGDGGGSSSSGSGSSGGGGSSGGDGSSGGGGSSSGSASSPKGSSASTPQGAGVLANFRHVRAFYLAVPPFLYPSIAQCCRGSGLIRRQHAAGVAHAGIASGVLAAAGLGPTPEGMMDRFVLEKPFGKDTASCAELCSAISDTLAESQLYRIDHYLGKELVMNVLVMRFANISFNSIWNRQHIHSVHVVCKEAIGTYGRGGYCHSQHNNTL